jgi:hypothetical protein
LDEPIVTSSSFRVLYADTDRDSWLRLLNEDPSAEVFAHPDYLGLFLRDGHRAFLAVLEEGAEGKRVLYPGILRDIRREPWGKGMEQSFDIIPPPFGYGGPFPLDTCGADMERRFFTEYAAWARQLGVIAEYATCAPHKSQPWSFPGVVSDRFPTVLRSLSHSIDVIVADYRGSVRQGVKSATRQGITIEEDAAGARATEFLRVYAETMRARSASGEYQMDAAFLRRLIEQLPGWFRFFHALQHGEVVSTELVLVSRASTFFFRGGTLREKLPTRANLLLKDGVIRWSQAHGKKWYVLGAGNSGEDDLFKYKRAFAPRGVRMLQVGRWTLHEERASRLLEARRRYEESNGTPWAPRAGFFPPYRAPREVLV